MKFCKDFYFTVEDNYIILHWRAICDRPMYHHLKLRKYVLKDLVRQFSDLLDE